MVIAAAIASLIACRPAPPAHEGPYRLALLQLDDGASAREAGQGLRAGLEESGLAAERDYLLTAYSAGGAAAGLPRLLDDAQRGGVDLLLAVSGASLAAALRAGPPYPIVFTDVNDPRLAGYVAPGWWRRWLPFLDRDGPPGATGAWAMPPFAGVFEAVRDIVDPRRTIGAVSATRTDEGEASRAAFVAAAAVAGRPVQVAEVAMPGEIGAAANGLCASGVGGLVALGDRVTDASIGVLAAAARACAIPLFGTRRAHALAGAVVTVTRDTDGAARQAGRMAAQVMRGARAATLPAVAVAQTQLIVNASAAERDDIGIPLGVLERADEVIED